jgi:hypothetical protein
VDLQLYFRVIWRFRLLVLAGLVLAIALAFLAMVRITSEGITYREPQTWSSKARLFVTQKGFPWGRAVTQDETTAAPDRFTSLAVLYAQFAESDEVKAIMRRDGPVKGEVQASPVVSPSGDFSLPLIDVIGMSTDPVTAESITARATRAILEYLGQQQDEANVPEKDRVIVQVVAQPEQAQLLESRPLTRPIVVYLVTLFGTIGLAFILHNLRPPKAPEVELTADERSDAVIVAGERRAFSSQR